MLVKLIHYFAATSSGFGKCNLTYRTNSIYRFYFFYPFIHTFHPIAINFKFILPSSTLS